MACPHEDQFPIDSHNSYLHRQILSTTPAIGYRPVRTRSVRRATNANRPYWSPQPYSVGFSRQSPVSSPHRQLFPRPSLEFSTTTASTFFLFDLGALAAPGVYNTVFGAGTGTLTVTETQVIPEPESVVLLLTGASAIVALRLLRRRS